MRAACSSWRRRSTWRACRSCAQGVLDCPAAVVHGWRDDVVPYEHSVRFAKEYGAALHLLDSDHRLHNQLRVIRYLFEYFLIALDLPARLRIIPHRASAPKTGRRRFE